MPGMMSAVCDVCGEIGFVEHHYKQYEFSCDCHGKNHFQICTCCSNCKPVFKKFHPVEIDLECFVFEGDAMTKRMDSWKECVDEINRRTTGDS